MSEVIYLNELDCYINLNDAEKSAFNKKKANSFDFTKIKSLNLKNELKTFVLTRSKRLSINTIHKDIFSFQTLCDFLANSELIFDSILEKEIEEVVKKYKVYLGIKGYSIMVKRPRCDRSEDKIQENNKIKYLRLFYTYMLAEDSDLTEVEKDIWNISNFDIFPKQNPINPRYTLNFSKIVQNEFKASVKKIINLHCTFKSVSSIKREVYVINRFCKFIEKQFSSITHWNEITRDIIEDYIIFLKTSTGLSGNSCAIEISVLRLLFNDIAFSQDEWGLLNIFLKEDSRQIKNRMPRGYSCTELERFNLHLKYVDSQIRRCILISQIIGTRISDTLTLKKDCIVETNGKISISVMQVKTGYQYEIPANNNLLDLIQDAIDSSNLIDLESESIFLNQRTSKLISYSQVIYHVNKLIKKYDILDDNGDLFKFKPHKLRHTFGIKLAELNVENRVIAQLLGHENVRSSEFYCKIRDNLMNEKLKKFVESQDLFLQNNLRG